MVEGNYAYIAAGGDGLRIINISNPASLSEIGSFSPVGIMSARGVTISGGYAYIANGENGLKIINISTPSSPTAAGSYATNGSATNVSVVGSHAYLACGSSGLEVIGCSDFGNMDSIASYSTPGTANDVIASGNNAYLADSTAGLLVLNISDLDNIAEASRASLAYVNIVLNSPYAFSAPGNNGLRIINISNPSAASETGFYNTGNAQDVAIHGNYAYVADYSSGLRVLDISNPASPVEAGYYNPTENLTCVYYDSGKIYAGGSSKLMIFEFIPFQATPTPTVSPTPSHTASPSPSATSTVSATHSPSPSITTTFTITPTPIPPIQANFVLPNYHVSESTTTMSVVGTNFLDNPVIQLKQTGNPDITASAIIVKSSVLLTCVFNLVGASHGFYDLFLDRGNSQDTMNKAFHMLRPMALTNTWSVLELGNCGVPQVTGSQNGITIADPEGDGLREVYLTNRNALFYQWSFSGSLWSRNDLPSAPGGEFNNDIIAFDKDTDAIAELYIAAQDNHIYEYTGVSWSKSNLGSGSGQMNKLATGDGDNDGEIELYAANADGHVYQFEWNGLSWSQSDLGNTGDNLTSVVIGDGDNDDQFEVYATFSDQNVYRFKYSSTWTIDSIGSGNSPMTSVIVSDLKDAQPAVYASSENGDIYQFVKNAIDWDSTIISTSNSGSAFYDITVSDAENSGTNKIYAACEDGNIYQIYFTNSQWTTASIADCGIPIYDLKIGDGSNDHQHEIYAIGNNSTVYQLKYISTVPTATPTSTASPTSTAIPDFNGSLLDKKYTFCAPNPIKGNTMNFVVHVPRSCKIDAKLYTTSNQFVMGYTIDCNSAGLYQHSEYIGNLANGVYLLLVKAKAPDGTKEQLIKKIAIVK